MNDIVRRWPSVEKIYLFIYFKSLSNPAPWPITQPRPFWRLPRPLPRISQINLKDPNAPDSCFIIPPKDCDSYKKLLRRFCAHSLFCIFGKLGKLCFFWCYCDPWYVRFKLTLEGFKVIIVSFWIKKKLLCTPFESDFQRSFYVISNTIWLSKKLKRHNRIVFLPFLEKYLKQIVEILN